jgi:hypothetical protein
MLAYLYHSDGQFTTYFTKFIHFLERFGLFHLGAVFFKFGRKAAEAYVAREEIDPLDEMEAGPSTSSAEPRITAAHP